MGMIGLANVNINGDVDYDSFLGFVIFFGGVANLNFGDYYGLIFEMLGVIYSYFMIYWGVVGNCIVNMEWESIDVYLLYCFFWSNGVFVEFGGKVIYLCGV